MIKILIDNINLFHPKIILFLGQKPIIKDKILIEKIEFSQKLVPNLETHFVIIFIVLA